MERCGLQALSSLSVCEGVQAVILAQSHWSGKASSSAKTPGSESCRCN